jgi:hypothetical protein
MLVVEVVTVLNQVQHQVDQVDKVVVVMVDGMLHLQTQEQVME